MQNGLVSAEPMITHPGSDTALHGQSVCLHRDALVKFASTVVVEEDRGERTHRAQARASARLHVAPGRPPTFRDSARMARPSSGPRKKSNSALFVDLELYQQMLRSAGIPAASSIAARATTI
jgi:hypothetical protein